MMDKCQLSPPKLIIQSSQYSDGISMKKFIILKNKENEHSVI